MPNYVVTPNMNLVQPAVGNEPSPTWASDLNIDMGIIDSHDHTSGFGVAITPGGLNINSDLPFLSNNATGLKSARFDVQSAALAGASDLSCVYSSGDDGDLYWNDANGNQIQITSSGGVAGTPGSIANLTSPASASWVSATGTFVWQSAASTAANMDAATYVLRYPGSYPSPTGNYIAFQAPSTLATGFAVTWPATLPSGSSFLTWDAAGTVSVVPLPLTAINISPSAGIVGTQLSASAAILGSQLSSSAGILGSQMAANPSFTGTNFGSAGGVQIYASGSGYNLNNTAANTLAQCYSGSSGKGYRILSGKITGGGGSPSFAAGGEGLSVSRSGTQYTVSLTVAAADAVIPSITLIGNSASGITLNSTSTSSVIFTTSVASDWCITIIAKIA